MSKFIDLSGKQFGRLTVLKRVENDSKGSARWLCECSCKEKTQKVFRTGSLTQNNESKSCGCFIIENKKNKKKNKRILTIINGMRKRCYNENDPSYKNYGGRGITICDEWTDKKSGTQNFYDWSINNGYDDLLSIDRIDVNGNYEPNNCRWATKKEQQNNTRSNIFVDINGEIKTIYQWSEQLGISADALYQRHRSGLRGEELFKEITRAKKQSIFKGITWSEKNKAWTARFKSIYISQHKKEEDAKLARDYYMANNFEQE